MKLPMKIIIPVILAIILTMYYAAAAFDYTENLQACYSFDTDASDDYATNDGTLVGTAHICTGCVKESCLCMDGDSDYVTVANPVFSYHLTNITVCMMVYFNATTDQHQLFDHDYSGHDAGLEFNIETDSDIDVHFKWEGTEDLESGGSTNLVQNRWQSVCMTFRDNGAAQDANVTYYVNGTYIEQDDFDAGVATSRLTDANTSTLYIGASDGTADWMEGKVDEYYIWNKTLSAAEVAAWNNGVWAGTQSCNPQAKNLYVNISHGSCDNTYTRAENNLSQPWCNLTAPLTNDLMNDGDTLYIAKGLYNDSVDITSWTVNNGITVTAYPGDESETYLTSYFTCNLWTETSDGIWSCPIYGAADQSARVYNADNNTKFFTWLSESNFLASTYNENTWYNSTPAPDEIIVNLPYGQDPNTMDIRIITKEHILKLDSNTGTGNIHIANLTFLYGGVRPLYVHDTPNVFIDQCNFSGGYHQVNNDGSDTTYGTLTVNNSYFDGLAQFNTWYGEDCKNEREENDAFYSEDYLGNLELHHNTFINTMGAISVQSDSYNEHNGSHVTHNTGTFGKGSQIEIENYCYNSTYEYNNFTNLQYAGVSFAPADASQSMCTFKYNIIHTNQTTHWNAANPTLNSYAVKVENRLGLNMTNWYVNHNTLIGESDGISGLNDNAIDNSTFYDNIIMAGDRYAIYRSGLYDNNVIYNNNLVFENGSTNLFQRYDTNAAVGYTDLNDWLTDGAYNSVWDTNSVQSDPYLYDYHTTYQPYSNSPACNMSTTNSYVGAVPCLGTGTATVNSTNSTTTKLTRYSYLDTFEDYSQNITSLPNELWQTNEWETYPIKNHYSSSNIALVADDSDYNTIDTTMNLDNILYPEIIMTVTRTHDYGTDLLYWLMYDDDNVLQTYLRINANNWRFYNHNKSAYVTVPMTNITNNSIRLRIQANGTTLAYHYQNVTDSTWTLIYNRTISDPVYDWSHLLLRSRDTRTWIDDVIIRDMTDYEHQNDNLYISTLLQTNNTDWTTTTVTWYMNGTSNGTDTYNPRNDTTQMYKSWNRTGIVQANVTMCDQYSNCDWQLTNNVTIIEPTVTVNIYDTDNNTVTTSKLTLDSTTTYSTGSPFSIKLEPYRNYTLYAWDITGASEALSSYLHFYPVYETLNMFNYTLPDTYLALYFVDNGTPTTTMGYIYDEYNVTPFNDTSEIVYHYNYSDGYIHVRFNLDSAYENHTQFYEYIKTPTTTSINETIELLDSEDWYYYVQVEDLAGQLMEDVTIRAYIGDPGDNTPSTTNIVLYSQRLTDAEGKALFYADLDNAIKLVFIKDNYETETVMFTAGDEVYTQETPLVVVMRKTEYTFNKTVWISTVNPIIYDKTNDINLYVTALDTDSIEYTTNYRYNIDGESSYRDATRIYNQQGNSDIWQIILDHTYDWDMSTTDDIYVRIKVDGSLWKTYMIDYQNVTFTELFPTTDQPDGTGITTRQIRTILWLMMLIIVIAVGFKFAGDYTTPIFEIGVTIIALIQPIFFICLIPTIMKYTLLIIRKVTAE